MKNFLIALVILLALFPLCLGLAMAFGEGGWGTGTPPNTSAMLAPVVLAFIAVVIAGVSSKEK